MNVSLTPQLEEMVKRKVDSGLYHSASEVIREALRLLEEKDRVQEIKLTELRQEIQSGLNSGDTTPLNMEDVIKRGRERLAQRKRAK